jgi:hypothetical protein
MGRTACAIGQIDCIVHLILGMFPTDNEFGIKENKTDPIRLYNISV